MTVKFSIITICRNEAARIRLTADSIVSQSCPDFEWIVIDGGSTDGTAEILNEYSGRMTYFISEPDSGIYDAMNKGSRQATGAYLLFLNGGDRLADAGVLASLAPALAGNPDLVMGNIYLEHPDGRWVPKETSRSPVSAHWLYRAAMPHPATLIRSGLFREVGEYDTSYRIRGDCDWFTRAILRHGAQVLPVNQTICVYNGEGISSVMKNSPLSLGERHRIRRKYYHWGYGIRWALNEAAGWFQSAWKQRGK
jgi:glycosyltransferase involved in cell wall biosynthesis